MSATDILGKIGEKVGGQIKTLETTITNDFATKVSLGAVQTNLGNVRASTGLGADGGYTANGSANYISTVTTLQAADNALDAQAKVNADAITALDTAKLDKTGGTISSNLTISGNLQVDGTTTTVNSTTVEVADNAIEVNLASDGAASANTAGIIVNRGPGIDKAQFLFDDTIDKFNLKVGDADGTLKVAGLEAVVTVPDKDGLVINTTSLGDYATFETAFTTAIA